MRRIDEEKQSCDIDRKKISLTDPSALLEAITLTGKPVLVYFVGITGHDECFDLVNTHMEELGDQDTVLLPRFFDFDDNRFKETLRNMDDHPNIRWILFVPEWRTTGQYEPLERWANARRAIGFAIDPESVPVLSHEEIMKLAPAPKREPQEDLQDYKKLESDRVSRESGE